MNFRRCITALAILTLFVGLAAAQTSGTGGGTAMTCNTVAQVTPTIRNEGIADMVGDVVITCQGGPAIAVGQAIPQGNIVVSLTAPVTSRLQNNANPAGANGTPSESILMIDEPNSGLPGPVPGFGPNEAINICPTPTTGCGAYSQSAVVTIGGTTYAYPVASASATAITPTYNTYQGNVTGNTVSFQGVPFLPPASAGVVRVYRITNIRVNATGVGGSLVSGLGQVQAYISTNGASTLPISQAAVTVAFVSSSLKTSVTSGSTKFTQCNANGVTVGTSIIPVGNVALLNFSEQIPNAFKTRIAPFAGGSSYIGTSSAGRNDATGAVSQYFYPQQTVPGQLYSSESGLILPLGSGNNNTVQAGLADFGTRLKAVFANLPSGATVYVSQSNVLSFSTAATSSAIGGYIVPQPSYATFTTSSETGGFSFGNSPGVSNIVIAGSPATSTAPAGPTVIIPAVALSGANPTAIWEVVNTNTSQQETFTFAVYIAYAPNVTANTPTLSILAPTVPPAVPAAGSPSVTMSYAPTSASSTNVPRFIPTGDTVPWGIVQMVPCQTILLFPFVTTQAGFDTGIAISNTSSDPFGTPTSSGTCSLNFYGQNAPTTAPVIGPIAVGTPDPSKAAFIASSLAPGFQGYLFATCNFQYAHGFAYITSGSLGTPSVTSMGYLALVVNNGTTVSRVGAVTAETLNN
jgi:hypothetical protein